LRTAGHWQLLGFGFFAIEEKASGRFIGEAGFHEMRRDMVPSIEGTLEAGWGITPRVQGKGYAHEAMQAALAWAAAAFPQLDYSCIVHPDHARSLHLARVLGFVEDTVTDYAGKPVVVLRKAWTARAPDPAGAA
jgi:RimJ/RimL family protein N-acetyltransferase